MRPLERIRAAIVKGLQPDAEVWADEWAEENRFLPPDVPEPGRFRNTRTPYTVDIQRTLSPSTSWREGWFKKPHQIGGSTTGENLIGTWICAAAGSLLVMFPTTKTAKKWELDRFESMRKNTPELRRRIPDAQQKGSDNTKLRKRYAGGFMELTGANSTADMKSTTFRYIKLEEPDEYAGDIGQQGGPIELAIKRTTNFGRKAKIYGDGTPTRAGASAIDYNFRRGDQRLWHLHCPDCGHAQPLEWSQLKWLAADPASAQYACVKEGCGALNTEQAWKSRNYAPRQRGMTEAQARDAGLAYWQASAVGEPGVASWHMNALGAPEGWRPWPDLVVEWLSAQKRAANGDTEGLVLFYNTVLGEVWTDTVASELAAETLQKRAEQYDLMTCPAGGLVVVAGVDTQDNRLAVVIRAFGRDEECWGVWHGEIYGHPSSPETWVKLAQLLDAPIRHASGQTMRVDAAAIDAGGHHQEDVFAFCRQAQARGKHWFAIRGHKLYDAPKLGRPKTMDFTYRGKPVPGGAVLRQLGTQSIKTLIYNRLTLRDEKEQLRTHGGGVYHFPLGFEASYYEQLLVEKRVWRRDDKGNRVLWWVRPSGARNEAWDCEVYLYAAFLYLMSGRHAETVWRQRERLYAMHVQGDLLEARALPAAVAAPATPAAPAPQPQADAAGEEGDEGEDGAAEPEAEQPAPAAPPRPVQQVPQAPAPQGKKARRRRGGFAMHGLAAYG